jgi:hypothetical protein
MRWSKNIFNKTWMNANYNKVGCVNNILHGSYSGFSDPFAGAIL